MRNPFRSEADAFRLLLGTIVYFALIAIAAWINTWVGVAVFAALTIAVVYYAFLRPRNEPPRKVAPTLEHPPGERRILVIANETVGGQALHDCIREKAGDHRANVLVVTPALNTPLQFVASDEDPGREDARQHLEKSLARLREAGLEAQGEIGDSDPLQAIEDALRTFGADEIIISTHPEGQSNWLAKGLVTNARQRFAVPITHVVVHGAGTRTEVR